MAQYEIILHIPGLILGLHPANERCRYKVMLYLIGWAQTQDQPSIPYPHCKCNTDQNFELTEDTEVPWPWGTKYWVFIGIILWEKEHI